MVLWEWPWECAKYYLTWGVSFKAFNDLYKPIWVVCGMQYALDEITYMSVGVVDCMKAVAGSLDHLWIPGKRTT